MRDESKEIRAFLIAEIYKNSVMPVTNACEKFGISRQAMGRHIRRLINEGGIAPQGNTRGRKYFLRPLAHASFKLPISQDLHEDKVWRERVRPLLNDIRENVLRICEYGFTEMLNNAIEHSEGKHATIEVERTIAGVSLLVSDDGVGIFNKIQRDLHLDDARHSILELAKGKLTTDPASHTGEGIFFSSRVFDEYTIMSGTLFFTHRTEGADWLLEDVSSSQGTRVEMKISTDAIRTIKEVFDKYASSNEDYSFSQTHIPVFLARYGDETLVSRSQAKRLLIRLERFTKIILDFKGVQTIGQAFADEVFRVFQNEHPAIRMFWVNAPPEVDQMIKRARSHKGAEPGK